MKQYQDCQLKGQILSYILNKDEVTSREIFESIQYPNYNSFRSELNQLKRYGYITISNDSRPHIYSLTKKGRAHAADPYIYKRKRQETLQHRVSAILSDDERFTEAVRVEVENRTSSGPQAISSGSSGPISQPSASIDDEKVISIIRSKDEEITLLQMQLQEMKHSAQRPTTPVSTGPQRQRTPEQIKEERLRVRYRKKLATVYASTNRYLDANFFVMWAGNFPYRMKHSQWYKPGSVEILSEKNPEVRARDHVTGKLPPDVILAHQFRITKFSQNFITVEGRGLRNNAMLRF